MFGEFRFEAAFIQMCPSGTRNDCRFPGATQQVNRSMKGGCCQDDKGGGGDWVSWFEDGDCLGLEVGRERGVGISGFGT